MSSDLAPGAAFAGAAAAPAAPAQTRPFYWSLRRELWEHRALYLAPAAVGAFAIFVHFLSALISSDAERLAILNDPARAEAFMMPYNAVTGVTLIVALLVGALYSLDALYAERRDRSILFWKSLPVSDRTAVLSKAAVPLLVVPLIVLAVTVCATLMMLASQTLVWIIEGFDARDLWARLDLPELWLSLAYGLPFMALWYSPLYAWLLFVSAWAGRMPFLWGAAPLVAALIVEHTALHMTSAHWMVERYLGGGVTQPYTVGGDGVRWIEGLAQIEPARLYTLPGLWIGVLVAAGFLFAAVRLRRARGPI